MTNIKLSTKIITVSIVVLLIFSIASFGILFRALSKQSTREMDQILKNEALALSALVNLEGKNKFDFEMPSNFLSQFQQRNRHGFFLFIDPRNETVLKESDGAPDVECRFEPSNRDMTLNSRNYRIETMLFQPELDREANAVASNSRSSLCLVVGIDKTPYWHVLTDTLLSSIPILILIVILLVAALLILIRELTKDLLALSTALTTANFGATHAFPVLPRAKTGEVKAIVEILEELHRQAAEVYREMWLFMGRAAHQIKTPVTAMQATIDVLLRKERSKDELLAGLEDVKSAAGLLNGLTHKLMSSARISYEEPPPLEGIDLQSFFKELVEIFRSKASIYGVEVKITSRVPLEVAGNRTLMADIFGNLLENAIIYSPQHNGSRVEISWRSFGKKAVIEISDQGPGFPENIRLDLYKPFLRGDERAVSGSGLGLSIAKKSANLLGGEVELAESTKHGAKIRVSLELAT